jgi:2-hydroxychromene-2-carboxylate isomerase
MSRRLEVYIDYKSPYAFIAKDPTYALAEEFDVEIDWLPLTLNIGSYLGTAKVSETGDVLENKRSPRQWAAVKYAYMDARRYASLRGLTLRGTQKIWDSSIAAIGMLWARQQGASILKNYTDRVYTRFWRRQLDIEDAQVITDLLHEAGANVEGFSVYLAGAGREEHDQLQETLLDLGYFGVPTYVIDGEVYFGREQLPRVRWHLAGATGPFPDIAYDTMLNS